MAVWIVSHKQYGKFVDDDDFRMLYVGPEGRSLYESALGRGETCDYDGHGDNIADKNRNWCELTALWWMWHNDGDDIIGLCHYRRYFGTTAARLVKLMSGGNRFLLDMRKAERILAHSDIIVPKKCIHPSHQSVRDNYAMRHHVEDLDETGRIIEQLFPDYSTAFETVMARRYMYQGNMFITKRALLDEYCRFLFPTLEELERRISSKVASYDAYNQRIYGFISERLFTTWLEANRNRLKIHECPYIAIEDPDALSYFRKNREYIKARYLH